MTQTKTTHEGLLTELDFGSPNCPITLAQWDALYSTGSRDTSDFNRRLMFRDAYIEKCGYHVVTKELVDTLGSYLRGKVVEVGSGSGWFAAHLRAAGHVLTCYDDNSWRETWTRHTDILHGNGPDVVGDADTVIMCWPDYDAPFAHQVAMNMKSGARLLHCGEGSGGCTGDDDFHDLVYEDTSCGINPAQMFRDKMWDVNRRFFGIHDSWSLWQKI